ncbi:MAG: SPFH domain-containing protein [Bacteroidaceae bacterium]|jgi:regulator of protease activity HflC (stomatin/prohibitin superfamily)|nr:SPFH domain-containing protein [Bacteroidaceae bacterium]MBR6990447.1 SPFH domain-containing protein [Bacteroidaceae bacterium]
MESKETEFKGGYLNGFLMCFIDVLLVLATIWSFINLVSYPSVGRVILCVLLFIAFIFFSCGFCMQEPNEAKVLTFFGRYVGTFRKTGFYWVNPLMTKKSVSLRARNLNAEPIKVNDKNGNPILIGLVVVWRLKDTYKAIFDIDTDVTNTAAVGSAASARMNKFQNFVAVQSDSALRQVAGMYAYDNNDESKTNEVTLRDGSEEINVVLENKLNERLSMAGLEVTEARINYLAYAPEIAAVMLRRQQAEAIISAREKIVEGAVGMVKMALDKLGDENIVELDEEKKAAMVSNLLVVLCADEPAQPVINSGTLNH